MKRLNHFSQVESRMKSVAAILFTMTLLTVYPFSKSFSNNLTITGVTYDQNASTVTFNLSWENSWRQSSRTAKNWDAAWVFVKWRDCNAAPPTSVQFTHGTVSTNASDHSFGGTTILEPTKRDGTVGIDGGSDNTGLMLRRSVDESTGTVNATVTMKFVSPNALPAFGTLLDLRVFGIEMVYVPTGAYVLGDGDGYIKSDISFTSTPAPAAPNINSLQIISENAQAVSEATATYCTVTGATGSCYLTAAFPKGYGAFYIMKYEISQGQYADFLNAINSSGQSAHYPNTNLNRMTIVNNITPPTQYSAERPDRACNYLSWDNVTAYLAWAALRPLSELEYEKACRGTETATPFQKAWGTKTGTAPAAANISGAENGTETIATGVNINVNSIQWTSGDGNNITGPLRCGIFATAATTSRVQTGMGFYGALELSGNISEYYISAISGVNGPSIGGVSLGSGALDAAGHHANSTWPTYNSPSSNIIRRGGSWLTATGETAATTIATNISYRGISATSPVFDKDTGGRGGR